MYALNKNELRVFRLVCDGHGSVTELSEATGLSVISIYRIVQSLSSKKLATSQRRGKTKVVSRSLHGHSRALATYLEGNLRPIEPLIGTRLLVMLSASRNAKAMERIAKETRLAEESVRRIVWTLKGFGAVNQEGDRVSVPPSDIALTRFLRDFSEGACAAFLEDIASSGTIMWSEGLQFIFATREPFDAPGVRETAITAMSRHGLQFLSDTRYGYYAYWRPSLGPEDIALHNVLIDTNSSRGIAYSLLFLQKMGYREGYLRRQGDAVGAGELTEQMDRYLGGGNVGNPFFPTRADMRELREQYGVR
ncbi:MAG: hypothetical protein AB1793_07775 [Candidatus Thermoplasmatota archaeon]